MADFTKRAFDIVFGSVLLLLSIPVGIAAAIAVLIADGRPIFFTQERMARGGVPFKIIKFRTMRVGAEADQVINPDGSIRTQRDDPRAFGIGTFLRQTSLDELPELWNVVKGDMSLVGPRPDLPFQAEYYTERQHLKLTVRPGMTGLAQVSGRNEVKWPDRLDLDVDYVERRSLWLDLRILGRTVLAVLGARGVFSPEPPARFSPSLEELDRLGPGIADSDGFEAARWHRLRMAVRNGAGVAATGAGSGGMATAWQPSPWDSEMLEISVARAVDPVVWGDVDEEPSSAADVARELRRQCYGDGVDLVVVRVPQELGEAGWVEGGFAVADVNVRFRGPTAAISAGSTPCRPVTDRDREPLLALAPIFTHDHFHADSRIPPRAVERLYRSWIANSLDGRVEAVLVAELDGEVAGFVTCLHDRILEEVTGTPIGLIELIGTAPQHRGRGVAASLLGAAGRWFSEQGTATVDVGTQLENESAAALYRAAGFRPAVTAVTLHAWVGGSGS